MFSLHIPSYILVLAIILNVCIVDIQCKIHVETLPLSHRQVFITQIKDMKKGFRDNKGNGETAASLGIVLCPACTRVNVSYEIQFRV